MLCLAVAWLLAPGCASAPIDGTSSDDGGDDSTTIGDAFDAGRDGTPTKDTSSPSDTGMQEAQADSTSSADGSSEGGDDSGSDATTSDGPSPDDGAPPDTGSLQDSAAPACAREGGADAAPPTGAITFVQQATASVTSSAKTLGAKFHAAQAAGDLIVIAVGWTDTTASVTSVTDSAGNCYALAVGPTIEGQDLTQSIYYAANIAAASAGNTITATFTTTAHAVDLRAAEYSGLSANGTLDVTAQRSAISGGASGGMAAASSGYVTTTTARELLFGAGMSTSTFYGQTMFAPYTIRAVTTNGNMFEDGTVSSADMYDAIAMAATGNVGWVVQLATFR
jgi:hypothetical protein